MQQQTEIVWKNMFVIYSLYKDENKIALSTLKLWADFFPFS